MPSFPCPHCDVKYGKREVLQTHIRFLHQAAQPLASSQAATIPAGLTPAPSATVMAGPYGPTQRAVAVTMPMGPALPSSSARASNNHFTIVFDTRDNTPATSTTVPVKESFAAFMNRLRALSTPLAGRYLVGRTDGFMPTDGPWRYALVHHNGEQEESRRLDSKLYYLTMMSELRKSGSPYVHALVWHVLQDAQYGSLLPAQGTSTPTTGLLGSYQPPSHQLPSHGQVSTPSRAISELSYLDDPTPLQPPSPYSQGPGQARTPIGIVQRRQEFSSVFYLVAFLEGGPDRWMPIAELQALGHQALIDDWERYFDHQ